MEHLNEETRKAVFGTKEERILYLHRPVTIMYPRIRKLLEILRRRMEYPKKDRMPNLLIVGESNIGKTTAIRKFYTLHPDVVYEDEEMLSRARKSVIIALAPSTVDEKSLYLSILEQFWASYRPGDTTAKLRNQVLFLMRECEVRILIIDEIHNLLETTPVRQRLMMNAIKNLSNELMIPIVGVGTETAVRILSSDPQHASRFEVVRLPRWSFDKEFLGLLKSFEKVLPLKNPSRLYSREKSKLLFAISGGNLGNLHRLLIECATYAIENGEEEITLDTIERFRWVRPTQKGRPVEIPL